MSRLRIHAVGVSADGFAAGTGQSLQNPMGAGGMALHDWVFPTRFFRRMVGQEGGTTGVDDRFAVRGFEGIGAWILGRNMFAPSRGAWTDDGWRGWWGDEPPYHAPVFVLTHHAHEPIEMEGGTTFHFVTDGFEAAFEQATAAAGDRGVDIAGGASTVRQALAAGVVDELTLDIAPVLLGDGERLFDGITELGLTPVETLHSPHATHVRYRLER